MKTFALVKARRSLVKAAMDPQDIKDQIESYEGDIEELEYEMSDDIDSIIDACDRKVANLRKKIKALQGKPGSEGKISGLEESIETIESDSQDDQDATEEMLDIKVRALKRKIRELKSKL